MPLPIAVPIGLGVASFIGGLVGNKRKQTNQINQTSTSTPTWGPEFSGLKDRAIAQAMRQLNGMGGFNAARNITNQRLNSTAMAGNAAQKGLSARLSAQGIRGMAAGIPQANLASGIFSEQVGAMNEEPILGRQFSMEDLQQAMGVLGMGRGTTTRTTGTSTGTETSGGGIGGGLTDLGEMIGWLASQGMLNFGKKGGGAAFAGSGATGSF